LERIHSGMDHTLLIPHGFRDDFNPSGDSLGPVEIDSCPNH
jgi:hypothetical protein